VQCTDILLAYIDDLLGQILLNGNGLRRFTLGEEDAQADIDIDLGVLVVCQIILSVAIMREALSFVQVETSEDHAHLYQYERPVSPEFLAREDLILIEIPLAIKIQDHLVQVIISI